MKIIFLEVKKMEEKRNQFMRQDDFNPGVKHDNSIKEEWIHKQVVKKNW